jgi:hypothetical protein
MDAEACCGYVETNPCMVMALRYLSKKVFSNLAFNQAGCKADDVGTPSARG